MNLNAIKKIKKSASLFSLTWPSDSRGSASASASGGGVSVSTESTCASCGGVFSVLGICSSAGDIAAADSSGGGVCISGSTLKDWGSGTFVSEAGGLDVRGGGWVA